ncbi:15263_t:CDS:2 [Cetraspora pellucida]|uniref:15263_t:CDS:1 n=1 Tax=Cetraspora pellucida TaxID=1433469 RepID=A0ACA9KP63_9GLOM|nr:15263_t:CDS:2 [Cetraspora pellucida]
MPAPAALISVNSLQLKIDEHSTTIVIIMNRARIRVLEKITNLKLVISSVVIPTAFQIIESPEQTLQLDMNWFCQTDAHLHIEPEKLEEPEDQNLFDNKDLDKAEGFLTDQYSELELYENLWLNYESPAVCLFGIKKKKIA